MSRLALAWERARSFKDKWAGQGPTRSLGHAAESGESWVRALFEAHGLAEEDMDAAGEIIERVGADTMRNLARLYPDQIDTPMVLAALFAAGFTNGLAVGLELTRD